VAEDLESHPVTDKEMQRLTDCYKLQYYFGGHWIAYRNTTQGVEVLAAGWDEIRELRRKRRSAAERNSTVLRYCEPWQLGE
jgi:hypothetical protein